MANRVKRYLGTGGIALAALFVLPTVRATAEDAPGRPNLAIAVASGAVLPAYNRKMIVAAPGEGGRWVVRQISADGLASSFDIVPHRVTALSIDAIHDRVALGDDTGQVRLYDSKGQLLFEWHAPDGVHPTAITALAFNSATDAGIHLFVADEAGGCSLWSIDRILAAPDDDVASLGDNKDKKKKNDKKDKDKDKDKKVPAEIPPGSQLAKFIHPGGSITAAAFLPTEDLIVVIDRRSLSIIPPGPDDLHRAKAIPLSKTLDMSNSSLGQVAVDTAGKLAAVVLYGPRAAKGRIALASLETIRSRGFDLPTGEPVNGVGFSGEELLVARADKLVSVGADLPTPPNARISPAHIREVHDAAAMQEGERQVELKKVEERLKAADAALKLFDNRMQMATGAGGTIPAALAARREEIRMHRESAQRRLDALLSTEGRAAFKNIDQLTTQATTIEKSADPDPEELERIGAAVDSAAPTVAAGIAQAHELTNDAAALVADAGKIRDETADVLIASGAAVPYRMDAKPIAQTDPTTTRVRALRFGPAPETSGTSANDSSAILVSASANILTVWDLKGIMNSSASGTPLTALRPPFSPPGTKETDLIYDMSFIPKQSLLLFGSKDKHVYLWGPTANIPYFKNLGTYPEGVVSVALPPNRPDQMAVSCFEVADGKKFAGRVFLRQLDASLSPVESDAGKGAFPLPDTTGVSLAFDPSGEVLAVGCFDDNTVHFFDAVNRKPLDLVMRGAPSQKLLCMTFLDDTRIAWGGKDGRLYVGDVVAGVKKEVSLTPEGEGGDDTTARPQIFSLAVGPGGRLAVGGSDGRIRTCLILPHPKGYDPKTINVDNFDPGVRLLPPPPGGYPFAHAGGVRSMSFRPPDGRILASGGEDGAVRLWRMVFNDIPVPSGPSAGQ